MRGIRFTIMAATAAILLAGCASQKKQSSRAHDYFRNNPIEAAEFCANAFPPRIEYRPGKTETLIERDTTYLPGDTLDCPDVVNPETGKTYTPKVVCPDNSKITEKWLRTDSLLQASTAAEEAYRLKAERAEKAQVKAETELEVSQRQARSRLWLAIGAMIAAGILLVLLIRK